MERALGRTPVGSDSEIDPPGLISSRGEINHSWTTESFFALHRALCLLHTLLVGKAEMWMVVVSGMALTIRSGAHISKGILKKTLKKCRMYRRMTNVIWRLEKTFARDRMKEFSLLSHQKREPER